MDEFTQPSPGPQEDTPVFWRYTPPTPPVDPPKYKLSLVLFVLTFLSALLVGTQLALSFRLAEGLEFFVALLGHPFVLLHGLAFSLALLGILLAHELGHYLACRYYGISATLPYFIPFPNLIGTIGAFIRIRSPFPQRRALFDVGIAGPLAGFLVALPTLWLSLPHSKFIEVNPEEMGISFGEPLIFKLAAWFYHIQPPAGHDLFIHPVAFAAWVGCFATALNLLPMGQLDGGHIVYALFGKYHRQISLGFAFGVIPALMFFFWSPWIVWALIPLLLGLHHPPTLEDGIPLDSRRKWIALAGLLVFILCFIPAPIVIH
jgi:membrane-associated protease RseP (regulator of RpoE activity)